MDSPERLSSGLRVEAAFDVVGTFRGGCPTAQVEDSDPFHYSSYRSCRQKSAVGNFLLFLPEQPPWVIINLYRHPPGDRRIFLDRGNTVPWIA